MQNQKSESATSGSAGKRGDCMSAANFAIEKLNIKGAYNANLRLDRAYHYDEERVIMRSNTAAELKECENFGLITFPTPVNNTKLPIADIIEHLNKKFDQWIIGNFIHGSYCIKGEVFDTEALSVEITNTTSVRLTETAKTLCELCGQAYALVKDCHENTLFFIRADT